MAYLAKRAVDPIFTLALGDTEQSGNVAVSDGLQPVKLPFVWPSKSSAPDIYLDTPISKFPKSILTAIVARVWSDKTLCFGAPGYCMVAPTS